MTALLVGFWMVASIAGIAGILFAISQATAAESRKHAKALFAAAQEAGLTRLALENGGFAVPPAVDGQAGPLHVHLARYEAGRNDRGTRVVVEGFGPGTDWVTLQPEGVITRLSNEAAEIGAPAFDDAVHLQGDRAVLLTLLDAETRRLLHGLLHGTITIGERDVPVNARLLGGLLEVKLDDDNPVPVSLPDLLAAVLEIARRLVLPADIPARLAANLAREPEAGVRWSLLRLLDRDYPDHPLTHDARRAALDDPDDGVRLRVAAASGEAGLGTLFALVASNATADEQAAGAVTALGARLPAEQAEDALRRALARGYTRTARACLEELAFRHGQASEELLLQAIASGEPEVILPAVRALGQLGTATALAPLRELTEGLWRGELAGAARQAIAEIQASLPGAGPGQLSLAAAAAGDLSLANEPGRISLVPEETARRKEDGWVSGT